MGLYHWYSPDGRPHHNDDLRTARAKGHYGSVTTVLGAWGKAAQLQSWIDKKNCNLAVDLLMRGTPSDECAMRAIETSKQELQQTADWGSEVHDRVEQFNLYGEVKEDGFTDYWKSWPDWFDEYVEDVIHAEQTFVDHEDKLAGTIDLVFRHKDFGISVLDYKNREFKPNKQKKGTPLECEFYLKDRQQLAYYSHMVKRDMGLDELPPIFSCGFNSKIPMPMHIKPWRPARQQEWVEFVRTVNRAWRLEKNL